ncbi:iron-containing alcohol dehydrogenase [Gimesia panareensis]|uniref:Alcohol dehydrogenase 2 n=1 Tax=Gimesia panareensis TaxID=2527978 RepID=A0A518FJE6_9PLAN|nr:iron-containing alcohol dehydrogenase [Gimesia panareensis]QDT26924.1 Alcohol dehydrogenase 2 [Gimesia panareensis]QDU50228.1 Alcohol dehydrogenase 2 [Gimesia panareensis]QDV16471.1 Alcohol dehydrogenase 2 [Gimesia panareensis]
MNYDFFAPRQIHFGWDRFQEVGTLAASLGTRALIISGSRSLESNGVLEELQSLLSRAGITSEHIRTISHEPEVKDVDHVTNILQHHSHGAGDFLIGIGGGSGIDLAKACSAMITNRESETVLDYLEGVGQGLQLTEEPLPLMAIPTTAGTGSEATKNAVISSYAPAFKKSLRSPEMIPDLILCDPKLACSVPPEITARTGMDAITQLLESYISSRAQPLPQALSLQGLKLAIPALPLAVEDGSSRTARENMAHAALLSGIALANSGLGMAHGVAPPLGTHCRIPHGLACAVMLPVTLRANRSVCETQYAEIARHLDPGLTLSDAEAADAFIDQIQALNDQIGIPRTLSELGVTPEQIPDLVAGSRGNSMRGNPREIPDEELTQILQGLL